jgi:hypothetical protein
MRANVRPNWGHGGTQHVEPILAEFRSRGGSTAIDYGCGLGNILTKLQTSGQARRTQFSGYDPGVERYAELPESPVDVVISTDVLEHIEPDRLQSCLKHIRWLTGSWAYINVHTGPANAILPDGRNAHLIQQPAEWWAKRLGEHYDRVTTLKGGSRPTFICEVLGETDGGDGQKEVS